MIRSIRLNARVLDKAEDKQLRLARDDLRLAANKVMTRLYLRDQEDTRHDEAPHTAAYRMLGGIKGHEPAYEPTTTAPVAGGVRSAVATLVHDRYREDRRDIETGRKSLATFRRLPLVVRKQEISIPDPEHIDCLIWGKPSPRKVRFEVWAGPRDTRTRKLWRAIAAGEVKHGDLRLTMDRLGRWYILLAHHHEAPEAKTVGAVLGVAIEGGEWRGVLLRPDGTSEVERFALPINFWDLWSRDLRLFREIGRANRLDYGLRAGRGRGGKIAPIERRRRRYGARVEDAARVLARAVTRHALGAGAVIALTDLRGEAVAAIDATEAVSPRGSRAEIRARFLRRNRGRVHELIASACARDGVAVVSVSCANLKDETGKLSIAEVIASRGREKLAAVGGDRPGVAGSVRAVAGPEAEKGEGQAASGEMIADSRQPLERSASSGVKSPERDPSQGGSDATDRGSRKRPPKHRRRRDL